MAEPRSSVMKYLMPLLPFAEMRQSHCRSKSSKTWSVMRSPPLAVDTFFRRPSSTTQPCLGGSFFLKFLQPVRLLPSKSSFQPAAFSAAVSVLSSAAASEREDSASTETRASDFMPLVLNGPRRGVNAGLKHALDPV